MPPKEIPRKKIVRTGCLTCKIRKIKCDEGKPACSRCVSTGRKCDGYRPIAGLAQGSAPPSHQGGTDEFNIIIRSLPSSLPGDAKERRSLYFFIHCTAPGLTGNFHSGFWEHLILQACISEPALRNIAVAIGSIHEMLSSKSQNVQEMDRYTVSLYAFQQYTRSVHLLNQLSATIKQQPEILLFSCILFICFDCLRGQYDSAGSHLAAGLDILYQWKTGSLNASTYPSHVSQDTLIRVFTALGIQAGFFVTNPAVTGSFWGLLRRISCEYPVNEEFISLEDARRKLNTLIVDICYVLSDTVASRQAAGKAQTSFTDVDANVINRQLQEDLEFQNRCFSNLLSWSTALENFLRKTDVVSLGSRDLRAATLLKIYHYTITMVAKTVQPSDSDTLGVEGRNDEFETILKLTKALLSAEGESAHYTFISDLGVIIPLYVIVVHCKDLSLRLEALNVLRRGRRREGLWDAEQVAKICERVLATECGENYPNERLVAIRAVSVPVGVVDTKYSVELDFGVAGTDLGDLVLRTESLNLSSG